MHGLNGGGAGEFTRALSILLKADTDTESPYSVRGVGRKSGGGTWR